MLSTGLTVFQRPTDPFSIGRFWMGCMQCWKRVFVSCGRNCAYVQMSWYSCQCSTTHCPSCLREFHTRAKVLAHLRHAHQCRQRLVGKRLRCTPMPGTGSYIDDALRTSTDGAVPFIQAEGPAEEIHRLRDFDEYSISLFERLYTMLLDLPSDGDLDLDAC